MKRLHSVIFTAACLLFLQGCYDRTNLEDLSLSLMIGLDVDEKNQLIVYSSSPVFNKEARQNRRRWR
ncbi:hypothetical protein [Paenibacillus cremeus]|uniref:Ger(X)C family spore germination protein n=1 Tax=Paenibacillus cremeus TaxID=2163881 RepID=A0A559JSV4_9BACL|nr:hypothetical protein [Paenibacillus cremeus]TVY02910.1 hypothetical protein FPZ49_31470 [Paenibacillus cremeus]